MTALLALLTLVPGQAPREAAAVFSAGGLSWDELCTVQALEGIANRKGPRLCLDYSAYWSDTKWNVCWLDIYGRRNGLRTERVGDLDALVRRFLPDLTGLVVYDAHIDGPRYVAMTLAGVDDCLPVSGEVLAAHRLEGLPIRHDLRGRFATTLEAYRWALDEVLPRTSRRFAHPAAGTVDGLRAGMGPFAGFDYCVMNRGFLLNLTFCSTDTSSFGSPIGGSAEQAELYRAVLSALEQPAFLTGYGEPEGDWFRLVGEYGHYYVHWGDNLSFHAAFPQPPHPLRQATHQTPETVTVEPGKYYVCFVTSEGDTMKGPLTFFFESWFDPRRGEVPINWAIHPCMSRFPAALDYYYSSATPNDYFVGAQVYNFAMPNLDDFAEVVKADLSASDLQVVMGAFGAPATQKEPFFDITAPLGVFEGAFENCPYSGYQEFLPSGVPVVGTGYLLCYWHRLLGGWDAPWQTMAADPAQRGTVIEKLVAEIEKVAYDHEPPFVVVVYTDLHNYAEHCGFHADVARSLDPARFRVARLDEAFSALRVWHARQDRPAGAEPTGEHH